MYRDETETTMPSNKSQIRRRSTHLRAAVAWCATVVLWTTALPAAGQSPQVLRVSNCLVSLIDDVNVPARVEGQLIELSVEPGTPVKKDDVLGRIDDAQVNRQMEIAKYQLDVAKEQAENDVNVRYAKWSEMVAKAEYQQALDANKTAARSYTQAELRRLMLEWGRTQLGIEQADHDLTIAKLTVKVREAELAAATENVNMHKILAPLDGIVVERFHQAGEWVKPGEPVFRVVRMNRLRIATTLDATTVVPSQVDGKPVTFTVMLPDGNPRSFQGNIVFVSPLVDVGMKFQVWAEVDNVLDPGGKHWLLRPGLSGELAIQVGP